MSGRAIEEIAIGAAAIGASFMVPGAGVAVMGMTLSHGALAGALISLGASEVMTGIADALSPNRSGLTVGIASPIAPWGIVYGKQKVGGVLIFCQENSNTGVSGGTSNNKQYHAVYCLASHPCDLSSDWELHLNGKQVLMTDDPHGTGDYVSYSPLQVTSQITSISRTNGVVTMVLAEPIYNADGTELLIRGAGDNYFNGVYRVTQPNPADNTTFTYVCGGPDTTTNGGSARTTYPDYRDKVRVRFLDGDHTSTFNTLLRAGTSWTSNDLCLGRTLAYIQLGYDDTVWSAGLPNVSFVIRGKKVYDPRTGSTVWSNNAALCVADYLCTPTSQGGFGLTMGTDILSSQLVAAANICDEAITLNTGGTSARYCCNTYIPLSESRGTILKNLLSSMAGRITYQGGTYMPLPGAWVSPSLSLTEADLVGGVKWRPRFSVRDTCNAVKGTYVSPENAWQQADIPPYMQDADHGFVTDPWLVEDNGERIFKEVNFPCTTDSATAQRLAKIVMMRARYQGRGTIRCSLKAYQAVALDVIQLSHRQFGWVNKFFEVLSSRVNLFPSDGSAPYVELDIAETDSAIYEWNPEEQLTPQGYKQPNNVGIRICSPPEDVTGYSGPGAMINGITYPSTISTGADGRVQNSIYVHWTLPNDANVVYGGHMEVEFQKTTDTAWTGLTKVSATTDHMFILGVTDGASYNIQARAVNCANVPSDWVFYGPILVSDALSTGSYNGVELAPEALTAQALSDGTAQITVAPFTANVGTMSASCNPSPSIITGLNQSQRYFVYYIDPQFQGGTITPIATHITKDFENKAGYFLIGDIVTPSYTIRYQPSRYSDIGSDTTNNPAAAYDNDVNTYAVVIGHWQTVQTSPGDQYNPPTFAYESFSGDCVWSAFPALTTTADKTLHVIASVPTPSTSTAWSASIHVKIGAATTLLASFSGSMAIAEHDYTMTIPAGTDLSTVSVEAQVTVPAGTSSGGGAASLEGFEIYIQ